MGKEVQDPKLLKRTYEHIIDSVLSDTASQIVGAWERGEVYALPEKGFEISRQEAENLCYHKGRAAKTVRVLVQDGYLHSTAEYGKLLLPVEKIQEALATFKDQDISKYVSKFDKTIALSNTEYFNKALYVGGYEGKSRWRSTAVDGAILVTWLKGGRLHRKSVQVIDHYKCPSTTGTHNYLAMESSDEGSFFSNISDELVSSLFYSMHPEFSSVGKLYSFTSKVDITFSLGKDIEESLDAVLKQAEVVAAFRRFIEPHMLASVTDGNPKQSAFEAIKLYLRSLPLSSIAMVAMGDDNLKEFNDFYATLK